MTINPITPVFTGIITVKNFAKNTVEPYKIIKKDDEELVRKVDKLLGTEYVRSAFGQSQASFKWLNEYLGMLSEATKDKNLTSLPRGYDDFSSFSYTYNSRTGYSMNFEDKFAIIHNLDA